MQQTLNNPSNIQESQFELTKWLSTVPGEEVKYQNTVVDRIIRALKNQDRQPEDKNCLLNLSRLKISLLPSYSFDCLRITALNLAGNLFKSFPLEILKLKFLKDLSLHANQLTSLPKEIGQLSLLKYLYLSENQLKTLPLELGQLKKLKWLDLTHNAHLQQVPSILGETESLQEIFCENTQINPQVVEEILDQCAKKRRNK